MSPADPDLRTSTRDIGGFETRTMEIDGEGPVLLLLHGYSDQADTWIPLLRELASTGRRAVALDLPGFGRSLPLGPGLVLPQLDEFTAAAIKVYTEQGAPPILVGNSLGAVLAIRAAADPDVTVRAIVPISPAGYGHARWIRIAERAPRLLGLTTMELLPPILYRRLAAAAFRMLASGSGVMVEDAARTYSRQFRRYGDASRLLGNAAAVLVEVKTSAGSTVPDAPMLLIWGERDHLTLSSGAQKLLATVGDSEFAELVKLPDCGHCPQLEKPAVIAALLDDFAGRLDSTDPPRFSLRRARRGRA